MITSSNVLDKPSAAEQEVAKASFTTLMKAMKTLSKEKPTFEFEVEDTKLKISLSKKMIGLIANILKATSQGKPLTVVPHNAELTTQAGAELLGVSRPTFVLLLETGKIPFTKIGRHRRVTLEDVLSYKAEAKKTQREYIIKMMEADQSSGLYDSQ